MTAVLTEGDVSRHAESDSLRQRRGLGEEVQVVEGKDQLDGFIHLNGDLESGDKGESSNTLRYTIRKKLVLKQTNIKKNK